jgi:staphyloferrin B biosynthesis citrate synthase
VAKARGIVAACRYRGGTRGFSNLPRAGGYGALAVRDHVDASDANIAIIAMIEDPEALVGVDGIDGFFIGRGDLMVALGAKGLADPTVRSAADKIIGALCWRQAGA